MKSNWLSSRLTKAKQASTMWVTLADSIQASFEGALNDIVDTITSNRSVMTMSVEEVKRKQESLGHFFSVLDVPDTEKNLTLLTRLDQIHLKATEFPIKDMVRRNFDGLEMDWSPVYAPIDQNEYPYGTRLIAQAEFDNFDAQTQESWFMTSRGRMILNLNKYLPPEEEMARIYDTINETIIPMIPLDIVFDGFFTQVKINAIFDIHLYTTISNPITDTFKVSYSIESNTWLGEVLTSYFVIENDSFSVDSATRSKRLTFDDRKHELLGEQPLGLMPLGASYSNETNMITDSLAKTKLNLNNWYSTSGAKKPTSSEFNLPRSNGIIYHPISCNIGDRHTVNIRKETNSKAAFYISESNSVGGKVDTVFDVNDRIGSYGITFHATSITMYLVVDLDSANNTVCSGLAVKKLTAI